MISKELKSQLSILKETNPEYIQTLKDAVMASYKAELQAIKPSSTEGFCEEMNVVYRTEELNTYLRYPKQEINPWDKHSTYIRLKLREILKVNLTDITIIDIISLP